MLRWNILPTWALGKTARVAYLGLVTFLFIAYVATTNIAAGSGYEMKNAQKKVKNLKEEIQKTDIKIAELSSMSNLEERLKNSGFVAVNNIQYMSVGETAVAKR
jgi:hypothetical protein